MTLIRLAARLGRPAAQARAIALATDARTPLAERIEAVGTAGRSRPAVVRRAALETACRAPSRSRFNRRSSTRSGRFDDEEIATALLIAIPDHGTRLALQSVRRAAEPQALGRAVAGGGRSGKVRGQGYCRRSIAADFAAP